MLNKIIDNYLEYLRNKQLLRNPHVIQQTKGHVVQINEKEFISFCSNDYLGLTQRKDLVDFAQTAISEFGLGSGGSRLLGGNSKYHVELEEKFAQFKGYESATLFNSAYLANIGLLSTICDEDSAIFSDELNHASIIDACRLTHSKIIIYPHLNTQFIENHMKNIPGKRFIFTETLFSMDGDLAPLKDLVEISSKYNAILIADDTHGTGVFGKNGRGVIEHFGLQGKIDMEVSNISKSGGLLGGFVLGSDNLKKLLISKSRPLLYTTSLPPCICAIGCRVVDALSESTSLREKLYSNINIFCDGLSKIGIKSNFSPIFPIIIGSNDMALSASNQLFEKGMLVPAIRPPTVPEGKSRLRISITALHEKEHIEKLLDALKRL